MRASVRYGGWGFLFGTVLGFVVAVVKVGPELFRRLSWAAGEGVGETAVWGKVLFYLMIFAFIYGTELYLAKLWERSLLGSQGVGQGDESEPDDAQNRCQAANSSKGLAVRASDWPSTVLSTVLEAAFAPRKN